MGVVSSQKARKGYKCRRGCEIHKGEIYYRAKKKFQRVRFGCLQHPFKGSELATSDKISRLLAIQEDLAALEFTVENIGDIADSLSSGADQAEEVGQDYEESADNMEEYFSGSNQIDEIREKAGNCEDWASVLRDAEGEVRSMAGDLEDLDVQKCELKEKETALLQDGKDTKEVAKEIEELEGQMEAKLEEVSDKVNEASEEMMF